MSSPWVASSSNIYFNTGSVGIGSSAPAYKFDVGGSMQYAGSLYNAGVLQPLVVTGNFTTTTACTISVSNLATYSVAEIRLNMYSSAISQLYFNTLNSGTATGLYEYDMLAVSPSAGTYTSTSSVSASSLLANAYNYIGGGWNISVYNPNGSADNRTHVVIRGSYCYAGIGETRVDASGFAYSPTGVVFSMSSGTLTGHYSVTYYP